MALTVKGDNTKPGGGFAVLEGPGLDGVSAVSIENCYLGLYLGDDGRWAKVPAMLPVEPVAGPPAALSLGPHIVDFIATDLQIGVRTQAGVDLGKVFWADIIPSRNHGAVTARDVMAAMREQAEERDRAAQAAADRASQAAAALREAEEVERREAVRLAQENAKAAQPKLGREEKNNGGGIPLRLVAAIAIPLVAIGGGAIYFWPKPVPPAIVIHDPLTQQTPSGGATVPQSQPHNPPPETPSVRPVVQPPVKAPSSGFVPRGEQDASFTCRPDLDEPVAQLICADGELAAADARMGHAFKRRFASAPSADAKRVLMQEQHAWLIDRNTTCDVPTTGTYAAADLVQYKPCVLRSTNARAAALEHP